MTVALPGITVEPAGLLSCQSQRSMGPPNGLCEELVGLGMPTREYQLCGIVGALSLATEIEHDRPDSRVHRHTARLAVLAALNGDDVLEYIDVAPAHADLLGPPEAGVNARGEERPVLWCERRRP